MAFKELLASLGVAVVVTASSSVYAVDSSSQVDNSLVAQNSITSPMTPESNCGCGGGGCCVNLH